MSVCQTNTCNKDGGSVLCRAASLRHDSEIDRLVCGPDLGRVEAVVFDLQNPGEYRSRIFCCWIG